MFPLLLALGVTACCRHKLLLLLLLSPLEAMACGG
jgi:hypothetical protein